MSNSIQTKYCPKCKQIKPTTEFHKNRSSKDGYQGYCIICTRIYSQKPTIKVSSQKAKRKYKKTDKGKKSIERDNLSEKGGARKRRYNRSTKGKAARKRFWDRHPNQYKARNALRVAILTGKLPKVNTIICHFCSTKAADYHHHKGYEPKYWLDVVPVCKKHHEKGF